MSMLGSKSSKIAASPLTQSPLTSVGCGEKRGPLIQTATELAYTMPVKIAAFHHGGSKMKSDGYRK